MNIMIEDYVNKIEAQLLNELAVKNESNLYTVATELIEEDRAHMVEICQAYEVVKHHLVG